MMTRIGLRVVVVVLLFLASAVPLLGGSAQTAFLRAPTWVYDFFTLDKPDAAFTALSGINNSNLIVGSATGAIGHPQGFTWANGVFTPVDVPGASGNAPNDVNDAGAIVGSCECGTFIGDGSHGFLYAGGTFTIAPYEQLAGNHNGAATGVNNHGRMVGWFDVQSAAPDGGTMTRRFGYIDGQQYPGVMLSGINDAGSVVGFSFNNLFGAFHYAGTTTTSISLPFRPDASAEPADVNNAETVVGSYLHESSDTGTAFRGFVWRSGKAVSINYPGAFTTSVNGINDAGIIVGTYGADVFSSHGFVAVPRSPITVTVNGAPGPATIDRAQPLRIDVAFAAPPDGPLNPAELYVGVVTPLGVFWIDAAGRFVSTPARAFAGRLASFGPAPAIQLPSASSLPVGTYTWFAIVDDDTNGVANGAFYDLAQVTIR